MSPYLPSLHSPPLLVQFVLRKPSWFQKPPPEFSKPLILTDQTSDIKKSAVVIVWAIFITGNSNAHQVVKINSLKCIFVFSKGFCEVSGPQLVLVGIFWYPSVSPVSGGRREEGGDCGDVSSPCWSAVTWRLHCRHWVDRPGQAGNKYFKYFTSFSHSEKWRELLLISLTWQDHGASYHQITCMKEKDLFTSQWLMINMTKVGGLVGGPWPGELTAAGPERGETSNAAQQLWGSDIR